MRPEQWAEILSRPRVLHARFTNIYKLSHQGEATATQKARRSRLKLTVLIWC